MLAMWLALMSIAMFATHILDLYLHSKKHVVLRRYSRIDQPRLKG